MGTMPRADYKDATSVIGCRVRRERLSGPAKSESRFKSARIICAKRGFNSLEGCTPKKQKTIIGLKWVKSSKKNVENNRNINLKRRQFIRRSHSVLAGHYDKKKSPSCDAKCCIEKSVMSTSQSTTASKTLPPKFVEQESNTKSINKLRSLSRISLTRKN